VDYAPEYERRQHQLLQDQYPTVSIPVINVHPNLEETLPKFDVFQGSFPFLLSSVVFATDILFISPVLAVNMAAVECFTAFRDWHDA
jgi:hypothetical protein